MSLHKTTGIILKKFPYGEKDLIVVWLNAEGKKMTGFARSARQSKKRFGGELDLFNHLEILYREGKNSEMVTLEGVNLLSGMQEIRKDLSKYAVACYFTEVILEFLQDKQKVRSIFDTFLNFLNGLNEPGSFKSHLIPLMEHEFLAIFGFKPFLTECLSCQKKLSPEEDYFFDGRKGGVVCTDCRPSRLTRTEVKSQNGNGEWDLVPKDAYPLSHKVIEQVLEAHRINPEAWESLSLSPEEVLQARNAFEYFIQYTAGKPFKSLRFLSQILN